jgi:hypothetical protein
VKLTKIDDAVVTRGNYVAAMEALIEGAVLAVLVVLLFLRTIARDADLGHCAAARSDPDVPGR